jgi:hypothetical protein
LNFIPELEENERQRRALLQHQHENKCYYLKLDPTVTPMFPQNPDFYFDPSSSQWHQMPEAYPLVDVNWGYPGMAHLPLKVKFFTFESIKKSLSALESVYYNIILIQ